MPPPSRWRDSAVQAAAVNAAVVVLVPLGALTYADYTSDAVRPFEPAIWRSALNALPALFIAVPAAVLVAWRTHVHARAYRVRRAAAWLGLLESTALAAAIALVLMLQMTALTWFRRPPHLVAAYIGFYVIGAAVMGLLVGAVLSATALIVLWIRPDRETPG